MRVDILAELLSSVRAHGALLARAVLDPPWSVRFDTEAPLSLVTLLDGSGWITPVGGAPIPLAPGDIAVLTGPASYTVSDPPDTPPRLVVVGDVECRWADGTPFDTDAPAATRTCSVDPGGSTQLLTGVYDGRTGVSDRLLRALPPVLVTRDEDRHCPVLDLVSEEIVTTLPGHQVVLDRLLDLLLVSTLRAWFDSHPDQAPHWYRAAADPVVGRALRLLHENPAAPWTVATLAHACGLSRAAFARRFTAGVGEPPMRYLAEWRVCLAADLLRETESTVATIARRVGYADAFALSVAFTRLRGCSPTAYRRAVATASPPVPAGAPVGSPPGGGEGLASPVGTVSRGEARVPRGPGPGARRSSRP
ncbi:AraC-type DNA-binding protein [Actinoalloteichus cyanogriseus DSM 43889]|uniref:AraC-type DNA-binding protein n=1 Tax=Actinoalloteichus caeruleus DSM 43889 TaxID=1120930 RepID=A0ABT1JGS6_ACTCY|nr:AraC-type DNA-binding protein [Actinoalloteichus caeruleus DSM 43889]